MSSSADGSGPMFDQIASRYDPINRLLSGGTDVLWRRQLVKALDLEAGATLLDLATGTADVAVQVAKRYPRVQVLGTDPSVQMLALGQKKVERANLAHRVQLAVGSAEAIELASNSVDAITIAFGIRNVQDRERALREMNRVCRPGGKIAILELSKPPPGILGAPTSFYIHSIVPRLGGLLSGKSEYRYLERSIAAFPPAHQFAEKMRLAGLCRVSRQALILGVAHLYLGHASELVGEKR